MIFLKIFSNVWLSQKKLRKAKMQLSYESGNVRSPLPDSGEHVWSGFGQNDRIPVGIILIRSILAGPMAES
jgi:hypothetical protein